MAALKFSSSFSLLADFSASFFSIGASSTFFTGAVSPVDGKSEKKEALRSRALRRR
jgi:hypothetical protein